MHPIFIFYGIFLLLCGIVSVIFIGPKAKTALISGGTSAMLSLLTAYFLYIQKTWAIPMAFALPSLLLGVFAWRSTKTLYKIFELVPLGLSEELKGKGIAFLVISLMAITSLVVLLFTFVSSFK